MISNVPVIVYLTFFAAVTFSLLMFYFANRKNGKFIFGVVLWGFLQSILAISGFYRNTTTVPPRIVLLLFPLVFIIILSLFSIRMQMWLGSLNLKQLTYLHSARIPVELVLYWLFTAGYVPELLTFEGRNFDILAGISALIVALIAFRKNHINKPLLWGWNILSIVLLTNVLINAIFSVPTVFQQFGFEQPNIAVLNFPFILLPGIIVPLVLISNIAGFVILRSHQSGAAPL